MVFMISRFAITREKLKYCWFLIAWLALYFFTSYTFTIYTKIILILKYCSHYRNILLIAATIVIIFHCFFDPICVLFYLIKIVQFIILFILFFFFVKIWIWILFVIIIRIFCYSIFIIFPISSNPANFLLILQSSYFFFKINLNKLMATYTNILTH